MQRHPSTMHDDKPEETVDLTRTLQSLTSSSTPPRALNATSKMSCHKEVAMRYASWERRRHRAQHSNDASTYGIAGVTCLGLTLSPLHPRVETRTADWQTLAGQFSGCACDAYLHILCVPC